MGRLYHRNQSVWGLRNGLSESRRSIVLSLRRLLRGDWRCFPGEIYRDRVGVVFTAAQRPIGVGEEFFYAAAFGFGDGGPGNHEESLRRILKDAGGTPVMVDAAGDIAMSDVDYPWDVSTVPYDVNSPGIHAFGIYILEQAPDSSASDHAPCPINLEWVHSARLSVDFGNIECHR